MLACKNSAKFLKKGGYLVVFSKFQKKDLSLSPKIRDLFVKHCPNYPNDKLHYLSYSKNISKKLIKVSYFLSQLLKDMGRNLNILRANIEI